MESPSEHFRANDGEEQRATALELFFDLVFVFAITQLSHSLVTNLDVVGTLETVFLLLVVWWAWIYTTWMTNWFDPDSVVVRMVLIAVMLASLLMAIAIPQAFGDRALLFGASYAALQIIRNVFIVLATERGSRFRITFTRILVWSAVVGAIWVAGPLAPAGWLVPLWLVALALDYAGPYARYWVPGLGASETTDWEIEGAHFAERFQLFIIVALGETIVVTGATTSDLELDLRTLAAFAIAFLGTAALWWLYFDEVGPRAQQKLEDADDTSELARDAYTYLHIPIVAGIVATAVGDEIVIAHPGDRLGAAGIAMVIGGPMLYLIGHNLFRLRMTRTLSTKRVVATIALLALAVLAPFVAAVLTAGLVVVVLGVLAIVETRGRLGAEAVAA